jgi:hypothetical protein
LYMVLDAAALGLALALDSDLVSDSGLAGASPGFLFGIGHRTLTTVLGGIGGVTLILRAATFTRILTSLTEQPY